MKTGQLKLVLINFLEKKNKKVKVLKVSNYFKALPSLESQQGHNF